MNFLIQLKTFAMLNFFFRVLFEEPLEMQKKYGYHLKEDAANPIMKFES